MIARSKNGNQKPPLIDTHAHLEMRHFSEDLPGVIHRARNNGIMAVLTVGVDLPSCRRTLQIAEMHQDIFAILGVHPHHAANVPEKDLVEIQQMAQHTKVRAFGEIGLDFYRNLAPPRVQRERFRQQIAMGRNLNLPLVIHSRDATNETLTILHQERAWEVGGVIHCYSGNNEAAKRYLDMNFYLSIPGIITYPEAHDLRKVVNNLPLDKLLLETDAPFLTPVPHRGARNEPAYVTYTAHAVATLRGQDIADIAAATTENARQIFQIDKPTGEDH